MVVILTGPPYSHAPLPYDGVWDQFEPQQTSHGAVCGAGLVVVAGPCIAPPLVSILYLLSLF